MVQELKRERLYASTLIIVSAKHGQSPIDVTKRRGIGQGQPTATISSADAFDISDDGSLLWLTAPSLPPGHQQLLDIQEIFAENSLRDKFNSPALDPRTPDIVLKVLTLTAFDSWARHVAAPSLKLVFLGANRYRADSSQCTNRSLLASTLNEPTSL